MITKRDIQRIRDYCFLNALEGVCQDNHQYYPCLLDTFKDMVSAAQSELDCDWYKSDDAFYHYINSLSNDDLLYLLNERVFPPGMERFHLIDTIRERGLSLND